MSEGLVWHIAQGKPGTQDVPDLTVKERLRMCGKRQTVLFRANKNPWRWRYSSKTLLCTRRTFHSGRHAAGDGQLIVAVWKDLS